MCIPCTPPRRSLAWITKYGWHVGVSRQTTSAWRHMRKTMHCHGWAIVTSTVDKTSFQNSVSLKLHTLGVIITLPRYLGVRKYWAYLRRRVYMEVCQPVTHGSVLSPSPPLLVAQYGYRASQRSSEELKFDCRLRLRLRDFLSLNNK